MPTVQLPLNANDYVWVRLSPFGEAYCKRERIPYKKPDEDGWSRWQLWELMQAFGSQMYMGNVNMPFEMNMMLEYRIEN